MSIYSEVLNYPENKKWFDAFKQFENHGGFEPMFQFEIDTGEMTIDEAWERNIEWFTSLLHELIALKPNE